MGYGGYGKDAGGYGKDMGKGKGGYGMGPYDAFGGKGDAWGGFGAFGGKGFGGYGKGMDFGSYGMGKGYGAAKGAAKGGEEEYGAPKKKSGGAGNGAGYGEVPGFKEALAESFQEAGVTSDLEDLEAIIKKCESSAQKQAKKFGNEERASSKMNSAECKSFLGEYIEAVMSAFSAFLYEKVWFDKVSFNGPLLMLVVNTFQNGKIFTRTLKTEIMPFIDDGLLAWSEEERILRQFYKALEAAGIPEKQQKKGNVHLLAAYDAAHFDAPYGTMESPDSTPEVAMLQEFVKGWMTHFLTKGYQALENGLQDFSPPSQVAALTSIFQTLMDTDSPCLPLCVQPSLPPAPWAWIEECANEVVAESVSK